MMTSKSVFVALLGLVVAAPAAAGVVIEVESNNSFETAYNIDGAFTLDGDPNIESSTTMPHTTVRGTGDGTYDLYSFTVDVAGSAGFFDIDFGMPDFDPWLTIFNPDYSVLRSQDDSGSVDPGSVHGYDPRFGVTFGQTGRYYARVGRYPGDGTVPAGADYTLQISIENNRLQETPVPEPAALGLLGLGVLGLAAMRRRKA